MLAGQAFEASRGLFGRASPQATGKLHDEPASSLSRDRVQGPAVRIVPPYSFGFCRNNGHAQTTRQIGGSRRVRPAWHRCRVGGYVFKPRGRARITYQPTSGSACIRRGLPDPRRPDRLGRTRLLSLTMSTFLDDTQCHAYDIGDKCSGVTPFQQFLHGSDAILPHP